VLVQLSDVGGRRSWDRDEPRDVIAMKRGRGRVNRCALLLLLQVMMMT